MVRARFLTPESIIKAIEARRLLRLQRRDAARTSASRPSRRPWNWRSSPQGDARYTTRFIGTLKGYDPTRKPVTDKDGKPLPVTQRYSDDVGKVLATVEGTDGPLHA